MLASVCSATLHGVDGRPVRVEAHVSTGLPGFTVVGLPDATCREARDRVRAALLTSGLRWPTSKVTVNLQPPGLRKIGAGLDLAIAVALLVADEQLKPPEVLADRAFLGELGLDGSLRAVPGALPLIDALEAPEIVVPTPCVNEARLIDRHRIRAVDDLGALLPALRGESDWPDLPPRPPPVVPSPGPDLADVRGQRAARTALEIAAAGGHHILFVGPPGAGKSMLACRLPGLLPDLSGDDAMEATRIHSAAGLPMPGDGLVRRPPYRSPHHSASAVALIGGGTTAIHPGELSLAHRGVLFLDELGEFAPVVLDNLRQPLEEGTIRIARAAARAVLPARVLLVAAMNPCPCGRGGPPGACRCSAHARARYVRRLSGPLLDRFDLRVEVGRPDASELLAAAGGEPTDVVAERVKAARARAVARGVRVNADLPSWQIEEEAPLVDGARALVERALRGGRLTGRGLGGVRRVALTVADLLGDDPPISSRHVSLALALRAQPTFLAHQEAS
jgi:magnesium chelatase family protein